MAIRLMALLAWCRRYARVLVWVMDCGSGCHILIFVYVDADCWEVHLEHLRICAQKWYYFLEKWYHYFPVQTAEKVEKKNYPALDFARTRLASGGVRARRAV